MIGQDEEPGLGNAGLARLASCFIASLAFFEVSAVGYNIRYQFGIFGQAIRNGCRVEIMDKWLRGSNPGEIVRPQIHHEAKFGGHAVVSKDERGRYQVRWLPDTEVKGEAYNAPIPGYRVGTSNIVRLSKAEAGESFDFAAFNEGHYNGAVADKWEAVLFRGDELARGKVLRLQRQYFF